MRIEFEQVVEKLSLLTLLREFNPVLIGTPPLGIAIKNSDIDVACSSNDLDVFKMVASSKFSGFDGFRSHDSIVQEQKSVIVNFHAFNWEIEIFCQILPTAEQLGVRHFRIEQRLLNLEPRLKRVVTLLKKNGMKTEPAFASALRLLGDPYSAILELENLDDNDLAKMIADSKPEF
jgi:hypothetical protein